MAQHAILSASSSKRWLSCPPSARLEQKLRDRFGDKGSIYAAEGTQAHALAELKLRHELKELNDFNFNAQKALLGEITREMDKNTDYYVDIVMTKYYEAKRISADAQLYIEQRLDFSRWVPHGFGTGDATVVSDQTLEVIDYKNGAGVPVVAVENPQARLYGLGGIEAFGALYGFTHVRNTIVQPKLDSVTEETLTKTELLDWGESIRPIAEQAWRGDGEFCAGDHCRFCAAKAVCYTRVLKAMELFRTGFDQPGVLPDEAIPGILEVAPIAEQWLKDIKEYALSQALRGQQWPGYKLVHGRRSGRAWRNEEAVKEQLIRAGYSKEQFMDIKLKSVSNMEKELGRTAFKALLADQTVQGEGALTLVPEDDKRLEYSSADADFGDLI